MPLEQNTVRFLDNFSGGMRGARSAEAFASQHDYAVLFLHRARSLLPYHRRLTTLPRFTTGPLDLFTLEGAADNSTPQLAHGDDARTIAEAVRAYRDALSRDALCTLSFTTLHEYLWLLRTLLHAMAPLQHRALLYSAAAVSDFYLLPERVAKDKIQSADGALTLQLANVPKVPHRSSPFRQCTNHTLRSCLS